MNSISIQNRAEALKGAIVELAAANFGMASTGRLVNRVRRLLADFDRKHRLEYDNRRAIAHLKSLTDQQLRDIGIARADIERAVRHGKDGI
jgi:uncharacterized protein YjiS (DUF1127 family)